MCRGTSVHVKIIQHVAKCELQLRLEVRVEIAVKRKRFLDID